MDVDDGRVLPVARHVERHVEECGDGPLAVAAGIVDEIRLDHVFGADATDERMRNLLRLAAGEVIDPEIAGRGGAVVSSRAVVSRRR